MASGDPTGDAIVLWTRATPPPETPGGPVATPGSGLGKPLRVRWELAYDQHFRHVVKRGTVSARAPRRDHTVKVDVHGLRPYTRYWYRFRAAGETSPVGRTQTAPDEPRREHALRFALVSCSNYTGGYFTAYRALGERDDLDFVLHVGDYVYEYGNGPDRYGPADLVGKRDGIPATETVDLEGYRLRHALHKADPDLQLAHAPAPVDHDLRRPRGREQRLARAARRTTRPAPRATSSRGAGRRTRPTWSGCPSGCPSQHTVDHQGTRFFKRFTFGTLADLSVLETRQNRSAQVDVAPYTKTGGGFIPDGCAGGRRRARRPGPAPARAGAAALAREGRGPAGPFLAPRRQPGDLHPDPVPGRRARPAGGATYLNSDQWDGYQADQAALIAHLDAHDSRHGDAVFLTGDIHSSWAMDVPGGSATPGYRSAGVEFVCPSVTSDGFYELVTRVREGRARARRRAADARPRRPRSPAPTRGSATSTASATASSCST